MNRPTCVLWMTCLAFVSSPAGSAGRAHEHGALKLDVAIDGNRLTIAIAAPLDSLLGFERAPRTDAERKAAADLLAHLQRPNQGTVLFSTDAAAQCTLGKVDVQAPALAPNAKPAAGNEHADLDASYEFSCTQPGELRSLDVGLFDAYKRIKRIDVLVAGPKGQSKVTLKRPTRSVKLTR